MSDRANTSLARSLAPVWLIAIPFAGVYCLIFRLLPESISAWHSLGAELFNFDNDGIGMLFQLASLFFGWATVAFAERRVGYRRMALFALSVPIWVVGIGAGFATGLIGQPGLDNAARQLVAFSLVGAVVGGGFRAYLSE